MFARSTTVQARQSSIDAGIAHMRDEVMPVLTTMSGCIGLSLLVDRNSGYCIATTAWESEEAMRDSAELVRENRDRAVAMFGGSAQVEEWEIASLHRDHRSHEGACVRATWAKMNPDGLDAAIETYKSKWLPGMDEIDGFCSASLMVDRASGRTVTCMTFDSVEAMERVREQADATRAEYAGGREGVEITDSREFELALAHLRVPELV